MRNYFVYNGVDSRDYGLYISGTGRLKIPEKAYNFAEIPGRNGDLIVNASPRVRNDIIVYPAFLHQINTTGVPTTYDAQFSAMRSWLMSVRGYAELYDSYNCSHYRLAAFAGPVEPDVFQTLDAGSFDLEFNCKPQRYLVTTDDPITITQGSSHTFSVCGFKYSDPLITINAPGTFVVGDNVITVASVGPTFPVTIDCRLMECYDAAMENMNSRVTFSNYNFPVIADGTIVTAQSTSLMIDPRWYEL